ncbi:Oxysterol-binding protein 3 [Coemansia sp. BCRC 34301]|nr:Oxysterol-binding protein 3 [Coemansia sp. BCRC 34301]
MEEIEILPRDAYLHTVHVSQAPCTIQWWFSTKRKNIDFGLFRRRPQSVVGDDVSIAGSIGQSVSAASTTGTSNGKRLASPPGLAWQQSEGDVRAAAQPRTPAELAAKQRGGQFKLQDRSIVELMPLKHYESSKSTIKGFWNAVDPGSYVLYFDNSFSKNTSKRLSFCVAVKEVKEGNSKPPVLMSGWLLKKKRKRMQGWARRWFTIQGHWLLYSTTEGGVSRAKIDLVNAVVSISKEDRAITIDSDEGFMQLRAQTDVDFTAWVAALQMTKEQAAAALPSVDAVTEGATLAPGIGAQSAFSPSGVPASTQQRIDMRHVQSVHASFEDSVEQLQKLFNRLQEPSLSTLHDQAMRYLRLIKENGGVLYTLLASLEGASRPALAHKDTTGSIAIGRPSISLVPSHASWLSGSGSDIFYDTNEMVEFTPDAADLLPFAEPTQVERVLRGSWSSHMCFEKSTTDSDVLWTAVSLPLEANRYYGFSYFAMRLNELVPATRKSLPITDTRFRPDQRAYEEGRIDDAEQIKHSLEEAQRARKRARDESGVTWKAQWFEEREDPYSPSGRSWQYCGGYWDAKAQNAFSSATELW